MTSKCKSDSDIDNFNMPERNLNHFLKVKKVCIYRKNIIYIRLGIIHGLKHPLGDLGTFPMNNRELLYVLNLLLNVKINELKSLTLYLTILFVQFCQMQTKIIFKK